MVRRGRHVLAVHKNYARVRAGTFLDSRPRVTTPGDLRGDATRVAVFNNDDDTVQLLATVLEGEGYLTVAGKSWDLRRDPMALRHFLAEHNPQVMVYDVAIPHEANWRCVQRMKGLAEFAGRHLVVTTTNKGALDQLVGDNDAIEIIGKPYDLGLVLGAVRRATSRPIPFADRRRGERRRA